MEEEGGCLSLGREATPQIKRVGRGFLSPFLPPPSLATGGGGSGVTREASGALQGNSVTGL